VLFESTELIVRGAFRAKAPLASLRDVRVVGEALCFRSGDDEVSLVLGKAAARWAAALADALATGDDAAHADPDLIVARLDDANELARVATAHAAHLARGVPLWVVYTKGCGAPLGETAVRSGLRERGLIDLKVASVSATLSALKFARRRAAATAH
jgi:hypothetical protein